MKKNNLNEWDFYKLVWMDRDTWGLNTNSSTLKSDQSNNLHVQVEAFTSFGQSVTCDMTVDFSKVNNTSKKALN